MDITCSVFIDLFNKLLLHLSLDKATIDLYYDVYIVAVISKSS